MTSEYNLHQTFHCLNHTFVYVDETGSDKCSCLLPQLLPYNGVNARSVVILDNASIHHIESATHLIEESGALAIFLPPYSPDYMPIEQCFSKFKSYLRAHDPIIPVLAESEIEELILSAFSSVTTDDCCGWMEDCGYII